jgi:hypothetical protein
MQEKISMTIDGSTLSVFEAISDWMAAVASSSISLLLLGSTHNLRSVFQADCVAARKWFHRGALDVEYCCSLLPHTAASTVRRTTPDRRLRLAD